MSIFTSIIAFVVLAANVFVAIPLFTQHNEPKTQPQLVAKKSVKAATNTVMLIAEPIVKSDLSIGQFDITIRLSTNGNDIAGMDIVVKSSDLSTLELTGFTPAQEPVPGYPASFTTISTQPLSSGELYRYAAVNPTNNVFTGDQNNILTLGILHAKMKKIGTANLLVDVNTSVTSNSTTTILVVNSGGQLSTYSVPGPTNTPAPIPTATPIPPTAIPTAIAGPVVPTLPPLITVVPTPTPVTIALPTSPPIALACIVSFTIPPAITANNDVTITVVPISPASTQDIWGYSTLYELDSQGKVIGSVGGCPNYTCIFPAAKNTAGAHRFQFAVRDAEGYNDPAIKMNGQTDGKIWCTTQDSDTLTSTAPPVAPTGIIFTKAQGDANGDKKVDEVDYTIWFTEITGGSGTNADFNGNGQIDVMDYNIWRKTFFRV